MIKEKQDHLARLRQFQIVLIVIVVFAAGFALGNQTGATFAQELIGTPSAEVEKQFEAFWQVYNLIQEQYVDPNDNLVTPEQLLDGAISGLVDSLEDQFSGYMPPDIYALEAEYLAGEFEGIGATIRYNEEEDGIEIVSLFAGSPAEKAGIRPGDIFMAVNGEEVLGDNQAELAFKVRGPEGTEVMLTMRRGEELIDFTVMRARIEIPNIEARVEEGNIGYIRLYQFTSDARRQIDQALDELDINEREGLIFDLRGNGGGFLNSSIDVASAFIEEGPILFEDFGEGREPVTFSATGRDADIQVPVVVLVDEASASASELVAGALQDTGMATIIGETTLGKGTVQTWRDLANGGGVRLTIARWKTPNGHWIHGQGITPDVLVEWTPEGTEGEPDPQLEAALEYFEMPEVARQTE